MYLLYKFVIHFTQYIDINECERDAPCHVNATCTNVDGSYYCACKTNYSGDGFFCEGSTQFNDHHYYFWYDSCNFFSSRSVTWSKRWGNVYHCMSVRGKCPVVLAHNFSRKVPFDYYYSCKCSALISKMYNYHLVSKQNVGKNKRCDSLFILPLNKALLLFTQRSSLCSKHRSASCAISSTNFRKTPGTILFYNFNIS